LVLPMITSVFQIIVVQDDEELPSRILADGDNPGEGFSELHESNIEGMVVDLAPDPPTMQDQMTYSYEFHLWNSFL